LSKTLAKATGLNDEAFIGAAYRRILARPPGPGELRECRDFLARTGADASTPTPVVNRAGAIATPAEDLRQRQNLILVLFNHNDFITVR
jgi:hypothetical protein